MTRNAVVTALALALTACAQPPCPDGQARDNAGQCVAVDRTQLPEGFVLDAPAPPGYVIDEPAKAEVDQSAVIEFNRREEAKEEARRARNDAEWRADRRADRIVEAQEDTRRAIEAVDSGR